MPAKNVVAGVDIGGTNTVIGLVDAEGRCVRKTSFKTRQYEYIDEYVAALCDGVESIVPSEEGCVLKGIGMGAPNMNRAGEIVSPVNISWKSRATGERLETIPLAEMVRARFSALPVTGTKDADLAVLGEMHFGGARGMRDFAVVTLGTGVGSGFVSNGEVIYGHDGGASELGHVVVERGGRKCSCGNSGCLERYASATGMRLTALELLSDSSRDSLLRGVDEKSMDVRDILKAAEQGDGLASEVFEITGRYLGYGLAMAVAITSPEAIFLFGGPTAAGDRIVEPTKRYMEQYLTPLFRNKVQVRLSEVAAGNSAVLGAASLVWRREGE